MKWGGGGRGEERGEERGEGLMNEGWGETRGGLLSVERRVERNGWYRIELWLSRSVYGIRQIFFSQPQLEQHNYTVEPLNNGHVGTDHFVHYREVVLFQRLVYWKVSFIQRCPLFSVLYQRFHCNDPKEVEHSVSVSPT